MKRQAMVISDGWYMIYLYLCIGAMSYLFHNLIITSFFYNKYKFSFMVTNIALFHSYLYTDALNFFYSNLIFF